MNNINIQQLRELIKNDSDTKARCEKFLGDGK